MLNPGFFDYSEYQEEVDIENETLSDVSVWDAALQILAMSQYPGYTPLQESFVHVGGYAVYRHLCNKYGSDIGFYRDIPCVDMLCTSKQLVTPFLVTASHNGFTFIDRPSSNPYTNLIQVVNPGDIHVNFHLMDNLGYVNFYDRSFKTDRGVVVTQAPVCCTLGKLTDTQLEALTEGAGIFDTQTAPYNILVASVSDTLLLKLDVLIARRRILDDFDALCLLQILTNNGSDIYKIIELAELVSTQFTNGISTTVKHRNKLLVGYYDLISRGCEYCYRNVYQNNVDLFPSVQALKEAKKRLHQYIQKMTGLTLK